MNLNFKIFYSEDEKRTLMCHENEIWISSIAIDNRYTFEKEINSISHIRLATAIKFKDIYRFKVNLKDNRITFYYKNVRKKNKTKRFTFYNSQELELVKRHLLNKADFYAKTKKENIITPFIKYGAPILVIAFILTAINLNDIQGEIEIKNVSSIKKAIAVFLYSTLGKTGLNMLGFLGGSIFTFLLGKRILYPANEIIYQN